VNDQERTFEFDVALSFAGEDRTYVFKVAELLRERGVQVFFADFMTSELWGTDLYSFFDDVFRRKARFAILFVSRYYNSSPWTKHERTSAQARALVESDPYILPVRLDDTELPGLRPTVHYVDGRKIGAEQLVDLILKKLGQQPTSPVSSPRPVVVPRTAAQIQELLGRRPPFWEYSLFAAVLAQGKADLEPRWLDHQIGYVRPSGPILSDAETISYLRSAMSDIQAYVTNAMQVLNPVAQEAAFGPRGFPGDPARIKHIGGRLVSVYEDLLGWGERVRGTRTHRNYARLCQRTAALVNTPLLEFRQFFDEVVGQVDRIPVLIAQRPAGQAEPIVIKLTLNVTVDPKEQSALQEEIRRFGG